MPTRLDTRLDFHNVTIGVLTALDEEYAACRGVFDPDQTGIEKERRATSGTLNCWICAIPAKHGGDHILGITRLQHMGNTAAAVAANILLQHCPSITSLIMCGIAGAVPHPEKDEHHVRLGDIVVSNMQGIIQYDFGKQRDPRRDPSDPFAGFEFRGAPCPPSPHLLAAIARMSAAEKLIDRKMPRDWEKRIDEFLSRFAGEPKWKRPTKDQLIDAPEGKGIPIKHPRDGERRGTRPRVFHGAIGAASIVLADPTKRDALRDRWSIRAVEMEAYGVADASWVANIGYLVVRGTCDYCNSTKNDKWHHYAAVIAAAYARTVVEYLHPADASRPNTFPATVDLTAFLAQSAAFSRQGSTSTNAQIQPPTMSQPTPDSGDHAPPVRHDSHSVPLPPTTERLTDVKDSPRSHDGEWLHVRELIDRLNEFLTTGRSADLEPTEAELEKRLRLLPRKGSVIRDGWIVLCRLETRRLLASKQAGKTVDVTRLQQLRREAENVTD